MITTSKLTTKLFITSTTMETLDTLTKNHQFIPLLIVEIIKDIATMKDSVVNSSKITPSVDVATGLSVTIEQGIKHETLESSRE